LASFSVFFVSLKSSNSATTGTPSCFARTAILAATSRASSCAWSDDFADLPLSKDIDRDFSQVTRQRGMHHYEEPLAWAGMLLTGLSPLTSAGGHQASSLLLPMEALFEAFVAKHLRRQLTHDHQLKAQSGSKHLMRHRGKGIFRMRPDIIIARARKDMLVVDTKWKLLNAHADPSAKYGLSQSDLYQMHAYGHWLFGFSCGNAP
jgi:5-methylcytosine-specific restriction enzyme subunit McrC